MFQNAYFSKKTPYLETEAASLSDDFFPAEDPGQGLPLAHELLSGRDLPIVAKNRAGMDWLWNKWYCFHAGLFKSQKMTALLGIALPLGLFKSRRGPIPEYSLFELPRPISMSHNLILSSFLSIKVSGAVQKELLRLYFNWMLLL